MDVAVSGSKLTLLEVRLVACSPDESARSKPPIQAATMRRTHHVVHLVSDILQPTLYTLRFRNHISQLAPDNCLRVQRLSERLPLRRPFQTFFRNKPLRDRAAAAHAPTFVIEVAEHDVDTGTFLSESVLDRDLDVLEGYVGGAGGGRVSCLDDFGFDTFTPFDEDDRETLVGFASNSEATLL